MACISIGRSHLHSQHVMDLSGKEKMARVTGDETMEDVVNGTAAGKTVLSAREKKKKGEKRSEVPLGQKTAEDAKGPATPRVSAEPELIRSRSSEEGVYDRMKVSVRGLPHNMTEDDILDYFSDCGVISEISCKTCPNSGRFLGSARITFAKRGGASKALERDGSKIRYSKWLLRVRRCKSKTRTRATLSMQYVGDVQRTRGSLSVCLSSLSENVDGDTITAFVKQSYSASKIWAAAIKKFYERNTRDFMVVAHVLCYDEASLEAAVKLNQTPLLGRPVKIAYAEPLQEFRKT